MAAPPGSRVFIHVWERASGGLQRTAIWKTAEDGLPFVSGRFRRRPSFYSGESMRSCGECALCCTLLYIRKDADFPFEKPAGVTCKHLNEGHGCKLHARPEFPALCRAYQCAWKLELLPEICRPDKLYRMMQPFDRSPDKSEAYREIVGLLTGKPVEL